LVREHGVEPELFNSFHNFTRADQSVIEDNFGSFCRKGHRNAFNAGHLAKLILDGRRARRARHSIDMQIDFFRTGWRDEHSVETNVRYFLDENGRVSHIPMLEMWYVNRTHANDSLYVPLSGIELDYPTFSQKSDLHRTYSGL